MRTLRRSISIGLLILGIIIGFGGLGSNPIQWSAVSIGVFLVGGSVLAWRMDTRRWEMEEDIEVMEKWLDGIENQGPELERSFHGRTSGEKSAQIERVGSYAGMSNRGSHLVDGDGQPRLNVNTASKEELMTLRGIGSTRADQIIKSRDALGGFTSVEQLSEIQGINKAILDTFRDRIVVEDEKDFSINSDIYLWLESKERWKSTISMLFLVSHFKDLRSGDSGELFDREEALLVCRSALRKTAEQLGVDLPDNTELPIFVDNLAKASGDQGLLHSFEAAQLPKVQPENVVKFIYRLDQMLEKRSHFVKPKRRYPPPPL